MMPQAILLAICFIQFTHVIGLPYSPVVLIPGNGGNQLDAKVPSESWAHSKLSSCSHLQDSWVRLWLDIVMLLPGNVDCFVELMELEYDFTTHQSRNKPGVATRVPGFGATHSVEYIDPSWKAYLLGNAGAYFGPLVQEMVSWGYTKGKNIRGAPYDFRFAPHSQSQYFSNLKALIEEMYRDNNQKKVVLLAHSAGGLFAHYLLKTQSQEWKDMYIKSLVTIGTPWDGAPEIFWAFTSGYNFGIPIINSLKIRAEQRSSETNMLLLPKSPTWDKKYVFVSTPVKNYTLGNILEYFNDIHFRAGEELMKNVQTEDYSLEPPGVKVHCWYGVGEETPTTLIYTDGFPDQQPSTVLNMDGDGTVTANSARRCLDWNNEVPHLKPVHSVIFPHKNHLELIQDQSFFNKLKTIL